MDTNMKGWFTEKSPMWPGQAFSLKVEKLIFEKQSKYQHIQIFDSTHYGRVLVLDGVVQLTEKDEASYQEMMAFMGLNSHPNPEKILVIGGGDGGVVRDIAKHPSVKQIIQCEIDEDVVNACKTHLPSLSSGFNDTRHSLHIGDGKEFLRNCLDTFDVIITDSSDPVVASDIDEQKDGPAVSLFNEEYYSLVRDRLAPDGILVSQGESMWVHRELIGELIKKNKKMYPVVKYAYTCTPSYPSGQIGLIMCSKNKDTDFSKPTKTWSKMELKELGLKYYNSEIHRAALILPTFMQQYLESL